MCFISSQAVQLYYCASWRLRPRRSRGIRQRRGCPRGLYAGSISPGGGGRPFGREAGGPGFPRGGRPLSTARSYAAPYFWHICSRAPRFSKLRFVRGVACVEGGAMSPRRGPTRRGGRRRREKDGGKGGAGPAPLSLFALQAAVRSLILLLPVPDAVPARPRLRGGKRALGRPCPRIDQLECAGGADPAVPAVSRLCCGGAYTRSSTPEILLPGVCCLRRQPLPRLLRRSGAPGRWPRSIFVVLALQCTSDPNVSRSTASAGRGERSGSGAPGILL
ncbi:hypothetical protein NDU88_010596 [Pleurodeles waltl]|uniref:Uncharacterized protein n=1 Tax=Pleurodeles waltl TaxID=8319 RepID=A0AAV7S042_PLEWA|nr:hypothetical protein NDU88_010596 [Pleurodeles waltl]